MTAEPLKWPLPAGHRYGVNPYDIAIHDGSETNTDQHYLWQWQRAYALLDRDMIPSGKFDGPTQRAVIAVQRVCGLTITAELDEAAWNAMFSGLYASLTAKQAGPAPTPGPRDRQDLGKLTGVVDTPRLKRERSNVRAAESAANKILWAHKGQGQAPTWYDLPEAEREAKIRSILGVPRGDLVVRLRGIQRRAGIPETGELDRATAWLLDEV